MNDVRFPEGRMEIVSAVAALASRDHQRRVWVERRYPRKDYYDDFSTNVHILYDDTRVLEDPSAAIGIYLRSEQEAAALANLAEILNAVFAEMGTESADSEYLKSRLWESVIRSASVALHALLAD
ncbi:hypothetical protein HCN51_36470 [Nonomuraea sp. FMUSA5-5]|uniref:Uncharacterized protein n=1 Tax=Nonomuraea composti TaxID=2720023 RepID=A0ABX1BAR4_9ACTN|nr:hypothetical protein [Nonomuraea sp. FMUSA5-5]NJP94869.1 hypothetical protein [Nonomuraea sp. FMUSA5-5]